MLLITSGYLAVFLAHNIHTCLSGLTWTNALDYRKFSIVIIIFHVRLYELVSLE